MARAVITVQTPKGPYPTLQPAVNSLDIVFTAADAVNFNECVWPSSSDKLLILARNSGAGARTLTISSSADTLNRTGDITAYSMGAGEYLAFIVAKAGWQQTGAKLWLTAEHAEVLLAVLAL